MDPGRSVNDFPSDRMLRETLLTEIQPEREFKEQRNGPYAMLEGDIPVTKISPMQENKFSTSRCTPDWLLSHYDESTKVNTVDEEVKRLQTLKAYSMLDVENDPEIDRLTSLAARLFKVPFVLATLVDLRRVWFLSTHGMGEAKELSRRDSLCSHAIQTKKRALIVPDCTKDVRFVDHPVVVGAPFVRFYAGVPLVSPEGYKIGTFCIIDNKARPEGLTADEVETLIDLSKTTVRLMVDRRYRMETEHKNKDLIASTAHDMHTPLTGLQLSLSVLQEDQGLSHHMDECQKEVLTTAVRCSEVLSRICQTCIDTGRQNVDKLASMSEKAGMVTLSKLSDLVSSIHQTMAPIPKQVPLIVEVDPSAPEYLACDDLKVFRAALNLLSCACSRTEVGLIRLRISSSSSGDLVVEVEDTAPAISENDRSLLFDSQGASQLHDESLFGLQYVALLLRSIGGSCGHRANACDAIEDRRRAGSVFWFSLPNPVIPSTYDGVSVARAPSSRSLSSPGNNYARHGSISVSKEHAKERITLGRYKTEQPIPRSRYYVSNKRTIDGNLKSAPKVDDSTASISTETLSKPSRHRRALVIEDVSVVRKGLGRMLSKMGYHVTVAVDGMQGLQRLKESVFDLVLCDYLMPVMDGFDCVKQFRDWEKANREGYGFRQHIVGISAHASTKDAAEGIRVGMDLFRAKPITRSILQELEQDESLRLAVEKIESLPLDSSLVKWSNDESSDSGSASGDSNAERSPSLEVEAPNPSLKSTSATVNPDSCFPAANPVGFCLIAISSVADEVDAVESLRSKGWVCSVVRNSADLVNRLKLRNWDAVFIDDELPPLSSTRYVDDFRLWESSNRVNRQNNLFLVCSSLGSSLYGSDLSTSWVQPPVGFDGVVSDWRDLWSSLTQLLKKHEEDHGVAASTMNIISR